MGIERFACLLEEKWDIPDDHERNDGMCVIKGVWVEDGTSYYFQFPRQLAKTLVSLQNQLCDKQHEIRQAANHLNDLHVKIDETLG